MLQGLRHTALAIALKTLSLEHLHARLNIPHRRQPSRSRHHYGIQLLRGLLLRLHRRHSHQA